MSARLMGHLMCAVCVVWAASARAQTGNNPAPAPPQSVELSAGGFTSWLPALTPPQSFPALGGWFDAGTGRRGVDIALSQVIHEQTRRVETPSFLLESTDETRFMMLDVAWRGEFAHRERWTPYLLCGITFVHGSFGLTQDTVEADGRVVHAGYRTPLSPDFEFVAGGGVNLSLGRRWVARVDARVHTTLVLGLFQPVVSAGFGVRLPVHRR